MFASNLAWREAYCIQLSRYMDISVLIYIIRCWIPERCFVYRPLVCNPNSFCAPIQANDIHLPSIWRININGCRSKFLFRRPPLSYVSNLFTLPFGRSVWIAIGIFLVLVIGLLYLAMNWEWIMRSKEDTPQPHWSGNIDQVPSFSDNLLIIVGAVSQQGKKHSLFGLKSA